MTSLAPDTVFYCTYVRRIVCFTKGMNTQLDLCTICERHVPGQVLGAQWTNGIWYVWLKNDIVQSFLINTTKTLNVYKHKVEIHRDYPTSKPPPNEKITFKDIPIDVSDEDIINYLRNHPGIVLKTDVIHGIIRDEKNNVLTQLLSGDRCVYVKGNFSPVLHSHANLNSSNCRILHTSQKNACMRCRHRNHLTTDIEHCEAYSNDLNVLIVKSPKYPMSNYFPCRMKMHNIDFASSEHAYQWRFLQYIDTSDLAEEVLKAPTAVQGDLYWSSGLSPYLAKTTKPQFYPGMNELGAILETVRFELMR